MPDYAIYFSSYFFGSIPDRNHTNASSVPQDECKISCFWKNNDYLLSKPSSVLQYQHSVLYHYQTSIIQFHFILGIKTARQPFNHHIFCTPLTRHQHCSVKWCLQYFPYQHGHHTNTVLLNGVYNTFHINTDTISTRTPYQHCSINLVPTISSRSFQNRF